MKTRIKVVEYNNGKQEFICQINQTNWDAVFKLTASIIGIPFVIIFLPLLLTNWITMKRPFNVDIDNPREERRDAIFDNIDNAKIFINNVLEDEAERKHTKHQLSVKKTYNQ
jgi:hypothetical protein